MSDTAATVVVEAPAAPGPGARTGRGGAQAGAASILLQLVIVFGWFGANEWTPEQTTAVTAAAIFTVGAVHNLWNWQQARRPTTMVVEPATLMSVPPGEPPPREPITPNPVEAIPPKRAAKRTR